MTIRPKTKRRVLYLLFACLLFAGCSVVWVNYRLGKFAKLLEQDKLDGVAAFQNGDFQTAFDKLSEYDRHISADKLDPHALLDFAIAAGKIPTKDGSSIGIAVGQFRRYCALVPSDIQAQEQLLELETPNAGYAPAALGLANDILQANPNDLVALKAIAKIDARDRKFQDAAAAADKYTQLDPTDLDMQALNFELMQQTQKSPAEMQRRADALLAKYPADPRFLIVKAQAIDFSQSPSEDSDQHRKDIEAYEKLVLQAARQDPPNAQFVQWTVKLLDNRQQFSASQELLARASAKLQDPEIVRQLALRLWENRKYDKVVSLLAHLDPASPTADVDLIAYKALSLYGLGKNSDAQALADRLAARGPDDHPAQAWAIALKVTFAPNQDLKTRLLQLQEAATDQPDNGLVVYLLGDTYAQMGEAELALAEWRQDCKLMPSWSEPHSRLARLLVSRGAGDTDEAVIAAEIARQASADRAGAVDLNAVIASIQVAYARLSPSSDSTYVQNLLEEVQQVQKQLPGEPVTLPIYIALLARTGQRDAAIDAINAIRKNPGDDSQDRLLGLVVVSRDNKLGMEPLLYDTIQRKFGMTPRLAYAQANQLLQDGHADDGLHLLLDGRKKNTGSPLLWDRAICQYREVSHNPDAAQAWQQLGDAYPNEIAIQSIILSAAESVWTNRPFIDRTINRLKALTSDQAITWKIYRARWLLTGQDPNRAAAATAILTGITASNPREYLPHVLLAMAYDLQANASGALDEWRKAADLSPDLPQAQFDLLQALHKAGATQDTPVVFDRLAGLPNLSPDMALYAATMMASEGDMHRAETLLLAYPHPTSQVLHDATLAKVYRVENRPDDATPLYLELAHSKALDANTIREAADFFAEQNDLPEARLFLNRLDELSLPAGQRQLILADFEDQHGSLQAAEKLYANAIQAAGDDSHPSLRQIGFFLRHLRWAEASDAIAAALARWPGDPSLVDFQAAETTLATLPNIGQYRSLIDAISGNPQSPAANQTIAALAGEHSIPLATSAQNFQALVEKYPDFEPLYELAGRRLMAAGRTADATALAGQALGRFPQSSDAARATAEANAAAGRWSDAIIAARDWRQRSATQPRAADEFIAMADLHVDQPQDAVDHLAPYLADAKTDPAHNQPLLVTDAEALILSGNQTAASALLLPLAQNSSPWRAAWLSIAPIAFADGASAAAWIEQVHPLLNPHSLQDQFSLAQAYFDCAVGRNYPQGFTQARDVLQPFVASPEITADQLLIYAEAASAANDTPSAERAYRQMLRRDPNNAIAQNNLADLLRQKGDPTSLKEAESLANQAIASHPADPNASNFYDTLARILLREKRPADAITAFQQANSLQPKDLEILIGLASTCAANNRIDDASRYISQIDAILPPGSQVPAELNDELNQARKTVRNANPRSSAIQP